MELCYDCDSMSDWEGSHTVRGQRRRGVVKVEAQRFVLCVEIWNRFE